MIAARYARLSVTERCNLRCVYCVGADGSATCDDCRDLPFDWFERFVRAAVPAGIEKFRLTGGEPLLHPRLDDMVRLLTADFRVARLGLTTNGLLLEQKAEGLYDAGLRTVNVSLPSLDPDVFAKIAGGAGPERVLRGIDKALALGFGQVKVNVVVMRGANDAEVTTLAALAAERPVEVRFIEYMPFAESAAGHSEISGPSRYFVSMDETMGRIARTADLRPTAVGPPASAARVYTIAGWPGRVGFIAPISRPFCEGCARVRLTARGRLRACLVEGGEIDMSRELANGLTPDALSGILEDAMAIKPARHRGRFAGAMGCIGG